MKNKINIAQTDDVKSSLHDDKDKLFKTKNNKLLLAIVGGIIFVTILLINVYILSISDDVLFHDNMTFHDFGANFKSSFHIEEKSEVKFSFSCDLIDGYMKVMICDEDNNTILSYDESNYSEIVHKELDVGTYYYVLYAKHANGSCEFKGTK